MKNKKPEFCPLATYMGKSSLKFVHYTDYFYKSNGIFERLNEETLAGTDLFHYQLYYDAPIMGGTNSLRKNGDISNIRYKVKNGVTRLNEHRYDEYSQITKSIYYEHNDDRPIPLRYEMGFECYGSTRKGGNCATLCTACAMSIRIAKSLNNQSTYQIDNLSYTYGTDNLRLTRVQDANTSNKNTQGHNQRSITGTAFTYDACGNVISDLHRAIDSIYYNHLHLPTKVKRLDGSKLEMTYDADDDRLFPIRYASGFECSESTRKGGNRATLCEAYTMPVRNGKITLTETRDYIGGIEVVNNEVSQINHSQGRLQKHSSSYRHEYVIKDHLGNNRVVYYNNGGTATAIDENHYYAYGLEYGGFAKTSGTTTYNYMFNDDRLVSIGINRESSERFHSIRRELRTTARSVDYDVLIFKTLYYELNIKYTSESFNLDFAFFRGLDPVLRVWMQVDPKAEQVIGMYPYCAMDDRLMRSKIVIRNHDLRRELCNPLHSEDRFSQMDPDGDLPLLAVMGIHAAINVGVNAAQGNINSAGDFLKHAAIGAVNGALSTINPFKIPIAGDFSLSIAPQLALGTNGVGVGFNATLGYNVKGFTAGINFGSTFYLSAPGTGASTFESRIGAGVSYDWGNRWLWGTFGHVGLGFNTFISGETSQTTGYFSIGKNKERNLMVDNDLFGDGGDRYRTAGGTLTLGNFQTGILLFTGDPGYIDRTTAPKGPFGTYITGPKGENPNKYRFGSFYFGYRHNSKSQNFYRFGLNSEDIRERIQNIWIHKNLTKSPYFEHLGGTWKLYGGLYSSNPFTTW